jgi:hypothetical protein
LEIHKVDLLPLKALILFIVIGVFLSFWGPIIYLDYEKLPIAAYMMSFLLLFTMGYVLGLLEKNNTIYKENPLYQDNNLRKILFWVKISILIISFIQFFNLMIAFTDGTLNLSITKMGEAYVNAYKDYERGSGNIHLSFLIQTLTYIPYLVTLILGAFYFKELPKKYKWLVVFSYLSIVLLETIGHGKQKQLGDMFIFLMIIFILKSDLTNPYKRKRLFKKIFIFSLLGVSALVSVLYFRYSALNINASNINDKVHALMHYDTDNIIFKIFGDAIGFPLSVFSGYLSQGYYGLSLSMQEPFEWTYFMGNSYSLTVFMQRFLGVPVDFHDTYPYRAALYTGWEDNKWSTVFAWFAGDFTFVGTLFLFALIAFLYAKVWKEAYLYQNPISIILFSMLTIALLYIPANNQLLHTPGSIIAVFFFLILWIFKHKKINFYNIKK